MKKNAPSIREIKAAKSALFHKVSSAAAKKAGKKPTYDQNVAWEKKHLTPLQRWNKRYESAKKELNGKADELLLAAEMGQMTSEEFYAAVKSF